jgi:hypothetical protein
VATEMGQYVKWKAKTPAGYMTGGSGDPMDDNVDAVPVDLLEQFIVSGVSPKPTVTLMMVNGDEKWYLKGQPFTPDFPMQFGLKDETVLTIDRNSPAPGDLVLTQE